MHNRFICVIQWLGKSENLFVQIKNGKSHVGAFMSINIKTKNQFNDDLLRFLAASPTPFHAVHNMLSRLLAEGFIHLHESEPWQLEVGKRYVVTRNNSSLIAFVYGTASLTETGIAMLGAHTDSPCLKVKPAPELNRRGYAQLGVEVYGGALLAPWFDRDLSLAGKVIYRNTQNQVASVLIDFKRPIAVIPSLAIHLDRDVNTNRSINSQKEIVPLLWQVDSEKKDAVNFRQELIHQLTCEHPSLFPKEKSIEEILDVDLSFYDTQAPAYVGLHQDFISSARLDNLLSCFIGLESIVKADNRASSLLICTDHEEVGSTSCCGAKGPMLAQFLERLLPDVNQRVPMLDKSIFVSADNAHGLHPNYMDKHDENHAPLLNRGPVIKINNNQRYATNGETSAAFRMLCQKAQVPVQTFVVRNDMACGSTIGPIIASEVGVKTVDVGVPTFAMHSIRELAGAQDAWYLYRVCLELFSQKN
jgi:aspartyl aminopeptidase